MGFSYRFCDRRFSVLSYHLPLKLLPLQEDRPLGGDYYYIHHHCQPCPFSAAQEVVNLLPLPVVKRMCGTQALEFLDKFLVGNGSSSDFITFASGQQAQMWVAKLAKCVLAYEHFEWNVEAADGWMVPTCVVLTT